MGDEDLTWLFDAVLGFLKSPGWALPVMSFIDDTAARSQLLLGLYPKFRRRSHKADGWLLAVLEDLCETFNLHHLFLVHQYLF